MNSHNDGQTGWEPVSEPDQRRTSSGDCEEPSLDELALWKRYFTTEGDAPVRVKRVVAAIADQAVVAIGQGIAPAEIDLLAKLDRGGQAREEVRKDVNYVQQHWQTHEDRYMNWLQALTPPSDRYVTIDWPQKGRGGRGARKLYALVVKRFEAEDVESSLGEGVDPDEAVRYRLSFCENQEMSVWARIFFRDARMPLTSIRTKVFILLPLGVYTLTWLAFIALFGVVRHGANGANWIDLLLLFIAYVCVVGNWIRRTWLLISDRIRPAGGDLVQGQEPALVEIWGKRPDGYLRLVRYSGDCPYCGGIVKVVSGSPDFSRRLVGRCVNSPREHVFRFDRMRLQFGPSLYPGGYGNK